MLVPPFIQGMSGHLGSVFMDKRLLPPLPPPLLRERVSGSVDPTWFTESGARTLDEWTRVLAAININLNICGTILDFGCGCGRVLRHLTPSLLPTRRIIGADVDAEAIDWVNENLTGVEGIHLHDAAPSPLPDNSIDIVVSQSVFTHLPEDIQFGWLADLHRITKQGGVVLTSVHGRKVAREYFHSLVSANRYGEAERFSERFNTIGFYYIQSRSAAEAALPEYYGATFHNINYIEEYWLPDRFQLLAFLPVASLQHQDILVLRKI
jgi:SAM-dependent methyltransferase